MKNLNFGWARWALLVVTAVLAVGLNANNSGSAQQQVVSITAQPGVKYELDCATGWRNVNLPPLTPRSRLNAECRAAATATATRAASATPTATRTATQTPVPPTITPTVHVHPTNTPGAATPFPGQTCATHDANSWHGPTGAGGCFYGHEHGEAPPAWVTVFEMPLMLNHGANTPNENILKHTAFKGVTFTDDGVTVYAMMHLDSHPNGQATRFHSVQIWARDAAGNVSYFDHWLDYGEDNNTGPNTRPVDTCGVQQSIRPIIQVNYPQCPLVFENWYAATTIPWSWDIGVNLNAQYYNGPSVNVSSSTDLNDYATWLPTGNINATRRIEGAWYKDRANFSGVPYDQWFYATQWGEIVSGPSDAVCGTSRTFGARSYTVLCARQYIASTLTTVEFPGNAAQKTYPVQGVVLPN